MVSATPYGKTPTGPVMWLLAGDLLLPAQPLFLMMVVLLQPLHQPPAAVAIAATSSSPFGSWPRPLVPNVLWKDVGSRIG